MNTRHVNSSGRTQRQTNTKKSRRDYSIRLSQREMREMLRAKRNIYGRQILRSPIRENSRAKEEAERQLELSKTEQSEIPESWRSRIKDLESSVKEHDHLLSHAVQPVLQMFARRIEGGVKEINYALAISEQDDWHSKVAEIFDTVDQVSSDFEDLRNRLSSYTVLQAQLRDLLHKARSNGSRDFRHALLTIYDASHSVYSEDLTMDQLEAIRNALEHMRESPSDREVARLIDRSLRGAGFETIPSDRSTYSGV